MLGKLLKYEMQAMGRILMPLYGVLLVLSVAFGLSLRQNNQYNTGNATFGSLYGAAAAAVMIVTLILIIQRFYRNLLGSEGYLMFCLPVSTGQHMANKIISATFWIILGGLVGLLSVILLSIMATDPTINFAETIRQTITQAAGSLMQENGSTQSGMIILVIEGILFLVGSCAEIAAKLYAAIAIGHQWSSHRVLGAVLAFVGIIIIEIILGNTMSIITAGVDDQAMPIIFKLSSTMMTLTSTTMGNLQMALGLLAGVAFARLAICWFISWILLDRRLNLA